MAFSDLFVIQPETFPQPQPFRKNLFVKLLLLFFVLLWVLTGATSPDFMNWLLENSLTVSAVVLLINFYRYCPLSNRSYFQIFIFLILHIYGSQSAYAENPLGEYLQENLGQTRNHYDRLVHFSFGLLLAYPMQEIFYKAFNRRGWKAYIRPIELTLSVSAVYELTEWLVAGVFFPELGTDFLGLQGDVWDAQKDMVLAVSGAFLIMLFLLIYRHFRRKQGLPLLQKP